MIPRANLPHPIRGLLIGPIVAPMAYWIGLMAYVWVRDFRFDWFQALRELMMITAFGLPIAYAVAFVWGRRFSTRSTASAGCALRQLLRRAPWVGRSSPCGSRSTSRAA